MCYCVVGAAAALLGVESNGGRGSAGVALPGQEGSSVRIEKGCDNQHVVGGGGRFPIGPDLQSRGYQKEHAEEFLGGGGSMEG